MLITIKADSKPKQADFSALTPEEAQERDDFLKSSAAQRQRQEFHAQARAAGVDPSQPPSILRFYAAWRKR
jgi:hypothetical protein